MFINRIISSWLQGAAKSSPCFASFAIGRVGVACLIGVICVYLNVTEAILKNDTPEPWTIGWQDGVSPAFSGIIELHDNIFFYLVVIAILVFWMLGTTIYYFNYDRTKISHKYLVHGTLIEIVWTIFPAIVLLAIAIPSFRLLYILDEVTLPTITVKVTGLLKMAQNHIITNKEAFNISFFLYLKSPNTAQASAITLVYDHTLRVKTISPDLLLRANLANNLLSASKQAPIRHFYTQCRAKNRIGPHNLDIVSTIYGLLLGDGYANNRSGEGVRIAIKQSEIHKEYLFFLYNFFFDRGYCSNLQPSRYFRRIKGKVKFFNGYEFNTLTFRSFVWIYNSFYKKGKKILPLNLEWYINEQTLAILIMDDGGWTGSGVRISTNSFSLEDVKRLKNIISNKFGLICTIQRLQTKEQYSIYITKTSIEKLREIILPFFHKSMYYKLGISL